MKISEIISRTNIPLTGAIENNTRLSDRDVEYWTMLQRDCKQALSAIRNTQTMFYRGRRSREPAAFIDTTRTDRKPVDSTLDRQQTIDYWLTASGFKAIRSNSIFCTGNSSHAHSYGAIYLIFPKDGFDFTWSSTIQDYYLTSIPSHDLHARGLTIEEEIRGRYGFNDTDLEGALKSNHEIYIHGTYYAFLSSSFRVIHDLALGYLKI